MSRCSSLVDQCGGMGVKKDGRSRPASAHLIGTLMFLDGVAIREQKCFGLPGSGNNGRSLGFKLLS